MSDMNLKQIARDDQIIRDEVEQIDWSEDCTSSQDVNQHAVEDFDLEELECVDEEGEQEIVNSSSNLRRPSPTPRNSDGPRQKRDHPSEARNRDHCRIQRKRKISSPSQRERDRRRREDYNKKRRSTNTEEKTSFEELEEIDCIEEETDTDSINTDRLATPSDDSRGVDSDMAACSWSDRTPDRIASIEEEPEDDFDEFPDLCEDIDVEAAVRAACLPETEDIVSNLAETTKDIPHLDETVPAKGSMLVEANMIDVKDVQRHGPREIISSRRKEDDVHSDSHRRRRISPVRRRNRSREPVARTPSPIRRRLKPPPGRREEKHSEAKGEFSASSDKGVDDTSQPPRKVRNDRRPVHSFNVDQKPASSSRSSVSTDYVASRVAMRKFITDLHARSEVHRKNDNARNRSRSNVHNAHSSQPIFIEAKKKYH